MPQGYEGLPSYYGQSANPITPNLGLSLKGMDPIVAEDFVLIDTFAGSAGAIEINGSVIPSANFINSAMVIFTILGNNISDHAIGISVNINGAPIAAPNFNDTTPAAPAGGTDV